MRAAPTEERSRERIERVAVRLFARYGYDGVSLQRIADEAGLHKSTLFHHYTSKLDLLDSVLNDVIDRVLECMRPLAEESRPQLDTLLDVVDDLVDHFSEEPEAARLVVHAMTAPDDSEVRHAGSIERVVAFFSAVLSWLERARRLGVIRKLSIRQAIPNVMGVMLFYPAVASGLSELVGEAPFASRAREIRKAELRRLLRGMLTD